MGGEKTEGFLVSAHQAVLVEVCDASEGSSLSASSTRQGSLLSKNVETLPEDIRGVVEELAAEDPSR